MQYVFTSLILILITLQGHAQADTLFILFEPKDMSSVINKDKHPQDTRMENYYPFDGGKIYVISKKTEKYVKDLMFSFTSYTPEWMDRQFYYQKLNKEDLNMFLATKDFKDSEWFKKSSYQEILNYFGRDKDGEKTIMIYDKSQPSSNHQYLVRVYFDYHEEE